MSIANRVVLAALCALLPLTAADWKAGVARAGITPDGPIMMSGYAARTHASEGKLQDLYAKALALEDSRGGRFVIVTTDLIGLPRTVSDRVAVRVLKDHGLERSRLLLNSSHTHGGPMIRDNLENLYALDQAQMEVIRRYSDRLTDQLVEVVGKALNSMQPADLSAGAGKVDFAINRRSQTPQGMKIGANPTGPGDHEVPILRVTGADGKLLAVLFGYACHNTTLGGDNYLITGDYAGYAQAALEEARPGTTAMFLMLCGGDQNPNPRGTVEHASSYGKQLAAEVGRVLDGRLDPVKGRLKPAFRMVDLPFASHTREKFEALKSSKDVFIARNAEAMLKTYDAGRPIRQYSYPVQGVAFGKDLYLIALGGEVVVDYDLTIKKRYPGRRVIVAGYSNDVMSYIPSLRVLREGGYEADSSMIYYGLPGPYSEDVEDRILRTVDKVFSRIK